MDSGQLAQKATKTVLLDKRHLMINTLSSVLFFSIAQLAFIVIGAIFIALSSYIGPAVTGFMIFLTLLFTSLVAAASLASALLANMHTLTSKPMGFWEGFHVLLSDMKIFGAYFVSVFAASAVVAVVTVGIVFAFYGLPTAVNTNYMGIESIGPTFVGFFIFIVLILPTYLLLTAALWSFPGIIFENVPLKALPSVWKASFSNGGLRFILASFFVATVVAAASGVINFTLHTISTAFIAAGFVEVAVFVSTVFTGISLLTMFAASVIVFTMIHVIITELWVENKATILGYAQPDAHLSAYPPAVTTQQYSAATNPVLAPPVILPVSFSQYQQSSATMLLTLAIISFFQMNLVLSIICSKLADKELDAIASGLRDPQYRSRASAARLVSRIVIILGTVILILFVVTFLLVMMRIFG